jgi:hypothetical protein
LSVAGEDTDVVTSGPVEAWFDLDLVGVLASSHEENRSQVSRKPVEACFTSDNKVFVA